MKLINDLIIENNGLLSVISKGTNISEALGNEFGEMDEFDKHYTKQLIGNIEVIENKINEYEEEIEGKRRDVDDWDMHHALVLDGYMTFKTIMSFDGNHQRAFVGYVGEWSGKALLEYIGQDEELQNYIVAKFASDVLVNSEIGENDNFRILEASLDGNIFRLVAKSTFDRIYVNDEPFYKGTYRTGGSYPDA